MQRRQIVRMALIAAASMAGQSAETQARETSANEVGESAHDSSSHIRMGYADTPSGQVHYRSVGNGPALVLLHWAPASGRMYEGVMPLLAAQGHRVLAFDLPGYGRSHKNSFGWPMERLAKNLLDALDAMNVGPIKLLGGHLSASVAMEMALAQPERVERLVLDGVLHLEDEEWGVLLQNFAGLSPMITGENNHAAFPFEMTAKTLKEWNPEFMLSNQTLPEVYALLNDYLEMGLGPMRAFVEPESAPPLPMYPIAARLAALDVPCLVLSADKEPLRASYVRSHRSIANSQGHAFEGLHPLVSQRWSEYADVVGAFMRSV